LLDRLKQLLVLNWRQKSTARSQLKLAIEDVLDTGLPRAYDKPSSTSRNAPPSSSTCTRAIPSGMGAIARRTSLSAGHQAVLFASCEDAY
jgi:hypothetical protein